MQKQYSAGAIIYYQARKGRKYLLLQDTERRWVFTKGILKGEELPLDCAKREVLESTGLKDLEFITGFKEESQYIFTFEAELVFKKVTWYLAKSGSQKVTISKDYKDSKWSKLHAALRMVSIRGGEELLKKADELLEIPRLI